jgi:hypothetical protein
MKNIEIDSLVTFVNNVKEKNISNINVEIIENIKTETIIIETQYEYGVH